jgi:hypothetical protein
MKIILDIVPISPRDVINKVMSGVTREYIRILGDYETVYRTLQRYISKILNPPPILFPELDLSHCCLQQKMERHFISMV